MYVNITPEGEKKKGREEIFQVKMIENFPQMNVKYQTTDLGSS